MSAFPARTTIQKGLDSFLAAPRGLRLLYSTRPQWPWSGPSHDKQDVRISVLDASFNPPTLAHRALACGPPGATYDAHLLIFSCQNADKGRGTSQDATPLQRLEMMYLLARELESTVTGANIAVGVVDPPLIMTKSTLCVEYIQSLAPQAQVHLDWQVGMDTLERFFAMRYYPSTAAFKSMAHQFFDTEGTRLVAALRDERSLPGKHMGSQQDILSPLVQAYIERNQVQLWNAGDVLANCSATKVRQTCRDSGLTEADKRARLAELVLPAIAEYLGSENVYQGHE